MKRDPINELFLIGKMGGHERTQILLSDWVRRYVKTASSRHYSQKFEKGSEIHKYQEHIDEKLSMELAISLVKDAAIDSIDETETGIIKIKTIFVLGDK